ncbi:MAG: FAD-dependent oxidoreductase [Pseudomonadota bacterium]
MRRAYPAHAYDPAPPPSFWATTVPDAAAVAPSLEQDLVVDFAVVGGGYTGLNAALTLAERGEDVALFDAAYPGWGASGRNGGFVCVGGSALDYDEQIAKFGFDETKRFVDLQRRTTDHVATLLDRFAIDADRHSDGEWAMAHSAKAFARGEKAAETERRLGLTVNSFNQGALDERGMVGPAFHGGHQLAHGFAINPLKYANGLARATAAAGARLYGRSPVHSINTAPGGFRLHVGGFAVRAKHVIVSVNGYGGDDWVPGLDDRVLPVMSSIMVTRPLTGGELQGPGWASDQAAYDTRARVHYFRLLPDGRFMMGTRGGSSLHPLMLKRLDRQIRIDFEHLFPHWAHVEAEYKWNGLLALARDKSMYVGPLGDWRNAWTAAAYHGNGVAMGSYAGKLLAELAVGDLQMDDLPAIMRGPLRRFPLPRLKMAYIKGYYAAWDIAELLRG